MLNEGAVARGVIDGSAMLGTSSLIGTTCVFTPTPLLSSWFISGSGVVMSESVLTGE